MLKNLLSFCPSDLIDSCRTLFTKWFPFLNWVSSKCSRTALSTSNDFETSHLETLCPAEEQERISKFYKARGLEVPSHGERNGSADPKFRLRLSKECTTAVRSSQRWAALLPVLQCTAPLLHLLSWGDRRRTPLLRRCSPSPPSWMCPWCWSLSGKNKPVGQLSLKLIGCRILCSTRCDWF